MNGEEYIANATTPEQHLSNVIFQTCNTKGWLSSRKIAAAHIKATFILREAEKLVASLEALNRKENQG